MLIEYGNSNLKVNVTNNLENVNIIPADDIKRLNLIGFDPCPGELKSIFINDTEYKCGIEININKIKENSLKFIHSYNLNIDLDNSNILYGTINKKVDVTNKCKKIEIIPDCDIKRVKLFEIDPCPGELKSVFINNIEYKHNKNIYLKNINEKLINILIRNCYRPNLFKKCIQSILSQKYNNYKLIMCYDDDRCLEYLEKLPKNDKIVYFKASNIDKSKQYFYNLYMNELLDKVKDGYIMFLDDDDKLSHSKVLLDISNNIDNEDSILLWMVKFQNILIYPKDINSKIIKDCQISGIGYCFHSKYKNNIKWKSISGADRMFYNSIIKNDKINKKLINMVLTENIHEILQMLGIYDGCDIEYIINKQKIKQVYVSNSILHFKEKLMKKYDLIEYNNDYEKALFFGIYNNHDINKIKQNKNIKFIIFGGSDVINATLIENIEKKLILSISNNIQERLNKFNLDNILVNFTII